MIIGSFWLFIYFLGITLLGWIFSYIDLDQLLVCYGCKEIQPCYHYIIVGCGTAGSVVARRLAESNKTHQILVIEAGSKGNSPILDIPSLAPMFQQTKFDWQYITEPQKHACMGMTGRRSRWPMGKLVGGTHMFNNLMYSRGHPQDYINWYENISEFSYDKEVGDYFKKSENFYNHNGSFNQKKGSAVLNRIGYFSSVVNGIIEALTSMNYVIANTTQEYVAGFFTPFVNVLNGKRWTTAHQLQTLDLPNVFILTKARADKILFQGDYEAYAVKINYLGNKFYIRAEKSIIISAGVIGSAKLLMLSGIGPADHLKKLDIPLIRNLPVGNNLQDHILTGFDLVLLNTSTNLGFDQMLSFRSMFKYFMTNNGPWTSTGCEIIGFVNIEHEQCRTNVRRQNCSVFLEQSPDLQYMIMPIGLAADNGVYLSSLLGINRKINENYFKKINQTSISILPMLLHPKSVGKVRLRNRNPASAPIIDPNYLSNQEDVNTLIKGIYLIKRLIDEKGLKDLGARLNPLVLPGCERFVFDSMCYWECYIKHLTATAYHPVGTCKMGFNYEDSVVNYEFHVHGTNKLFVVDASVFPTLTSSNINAAVIMLAEKAAESVLTTYHMTVAVTEKKDIFVPKDKCY